MAQGVQTECTQPGDLGILAKDEEVSTRVRCAERTWHTRQLLFGDPHLSIPGVHPHKITHYCILGTHLTPRTCAQATISC